MSTTELPGSFAALGVAPELVSALESQGITEPFPIQALTIADALAGRDVCGKAKTGSGKTLAFGVPVLQRLGAAQPGRPSLAGARRPRGLVLVPTRELARQVADVLIPLAEKVGLAADALLRRGRDGRPDQVPGRRHRRGGRHAGPADRPAPAGRRRPEPDRGPGPRRGRPHGRHGLHAQVEWLLRHLVGDHQTMLFSATLDGDVDRLVRDYLTDPVRHEVASDAADGHRHGAPFSPGPPNGQGEGGRRHLPATPQRSLVFSRTKRGADRLTEALRKEGVDARAIHGDLRQQLRERALRSFVGGQAAGAGGDRRGGPRHRRRRHRRGDPLRSARGPQGLPAPLRAAPPGPAAKGWW